MERAIRVVSVERGTTRASSALLAFGGAGACTRASGHGPGHVHRARPAQRGRALGARPAARRCGARLLAGDPAARHGPHARRSARCVRAARRAGARRPARRGFDEADIQLTRTSGPCATRDSPTRSACRCRPRTARCSTSATRNCTATAHRRARRKSWPCGCAGSGRRASRRSGTCLRRVAVAPPIGARPARFGASWRVGAHFALDALLPAWPAPARPWIAGGEATIVVPRVRLPRARVWHLRVVAHRPTRRRTRHRLGLAA